MNSAVALLEAIANHIALPPRLPGSQDAEPELIDRALNDRMIAAARTLRDLSNHDSISIWENLRHILATAKILNIDKKLEKTTLLSEFRGLQRDGLLILHVTEQNSGLVIRRDHDEQRETVVFEAFEASPLSEQVLAAKGALQRDFPGSAVAIPHSVFSESSFQDNLAAFLEQASTESIKRFAATSKKAGASAIECRDTVNPALITQMLMTLLEAYGNRIHPPQLRKRTHDDVCWANAEAPWRRSAYWLVLRVGIQRHLSIMHGGERGRVYYKFLMCMILAELMEDATNHVGPELLDFMKRKLSRRLAKLEVNRADASSKVRQLYDSMFTLLGSRFHKTLKNATLRIEMAWNTFKKSIQRRVFPLPLRANTADTILTLAHSRAYLWQVMKWDLHMNIVHSVPQPFDFSAATGASFDAFAQRYFNLSKSESMVEKSLLTPPLAMMSSDERCIELAEQIQRYIDSVGDAYNLDPEQKGNMLLFVMRLWMAMDQCAIRLFPLLAEFNPGIAAEILDVLLVSHAVDMDHLLDIQQHIQNRWDECGHNPLSIFDGPSSGCFAERYYDSSEDSTRLQGRRAAIEYAAERERTRKKREWEDKSAEFEELEKEVAESACVYTVERYERIHDPRCHKCYLRRKSRRMTIQVHEHPLPANPAEAKAVIFEIACPQAFSAYRNATWRILGILAQPKRPDPSVPRMVLPDYSELASWLNHSATPGITLASSSKSFLQTHFKGVRFPVSFDCVSFPNGLKFAYYDTITQSYPGRCRAKPTFAHHSQITIPTNSPFSPLQFSPWFAVDSDGPSSYEVVASQAKCPDGLNAHEFMAYQNLLSGKHRRWASILIELSSSNLNFSMDATSSLVAHLALQVGPIHDSDPLRVVHRVFRDGSFCKRLSEQIAQRLDGIASNWRENNCMDMLITLILRLCSLANGSAVSIAMDLLEKARSITLQWIRQLHVETRKSTDLITSRRNSQYALSASLLCRRTFHLYSTTSQKRLGPEALCHFIEASIAVQDNLAGDPATYPVNMRRALVRDLKMAYHMRSILLQSINASPESLQSAIDNIWPRGEGVALRTYSRMKIYQGQQNQYIWVSLEIDATDTTRQQILHYELLCGSLFIDGQRLGKLPAEHRESVVLKQLFGNQSLLTWPSGVRGMTYQLSYPIEGHEIHIGIRQGALFVRAYYRGSILELIPPEKFGDFSSFDLPGSLIRGCIHWLDVCTGRLEVRQSSNIWRRKPSNWTLDVRNSKAFRKNSTLIDPHSPTFQQIIRILDRFELPSQITVYQPLKFNLSVEIRRLELNFFVNGSGLLQCRELQAEMDPNQDAGTWYGLDSKIVLRDVSNRKRRSIIVPMGPLTTTRNMFHVAINVANEGTYARYTINDVLGRLECPAEPWLLYTKAQFHAYTSFVVPDPLTGRTGTEEALHALKSGCFQPWTTLASGALQCLLSIAKLAPRREYYPKGAKLMQHVFWDSALTVTIQHEGFRFLAEQLHDKTKALSLFALEEVGIPELEPAGDRDLLQRGYARRVMYERRDGSCNEQQAPPDTACVGRDIPEVNQMRLNVFESTVLLKNWSSTVFATEDLHGILQDWPIIGGYDRVFDKVLITDRLQVDFGLEWGALVELCRKSGREDVHQLAFLFAALSFRDSVDMSIIRTLIAFAVLERLKSLEYPQWSSYSHYQRHHVPSAAYLMQLIKPCAVPYPGDERDVLWNIGYRQRKKLEAAQSDHEQRVENDCRTLALSLLSQWPCSEPILVEGEKPLLLDTAQAMTILRPEWLRLFQNIELACHVDQVQQILNHNRGEQQTEQPDRQPASEEVFLIGFHSDVIPTLSGELLNKVGPVVTEASTLIMPHEYGLRPMAGNASSLRLTMDQGDDRGKVSPVKSQGTMVSREITDLRKIVADIAKSKSNVQQQYARDLLQSIEAFDSVRSEPDIDEKPIARAALTSQISQSRDQLQERLLKIRTALEQEDERARWLTVGGLWPCTSPVALLEQLRSTSPAVFGSNMKESLVGYGLSITKLQRYLRIEDAYIKDNKQRLHEEQKNPGHQNWSPVDRPDWVLLEIDADMLIRPEQVDVAIATMDPASGSNSVLQMNMGQGKTSCIMPMVAVAMADSKQLMRVIVPKALLLQTAQLLQGRLGGLLGREVKHVPFSRKTPTNEDTIKMFFNIHKSIKDSSGVIVALPEHVMSFMLSGIQRLSDERILEATKMVKVQAWMRKVSRDVLDECDFTLAVRTQLIYPSGPQSTVDGHPQRWETAEALLHMVRDHLWSLHYDFRQSIEIIQRPEGGFPFVFFLRRDVEEALLTRMVNDIVQARTSILPMKDCTRAERDVIRQFITQESISQVVAGRIEKLFPDKPIAKQNLYLLRGLLVHRILLLTLKKRWNVQYGLHPLRDPIAVPYQAKGVPSEQAEWGHPDVAILFTCLSFYFGGLSVPQLRQSLQHLVKSDDPFSEYDRWTHARSSLPDTMRDWNIINTDDELQLIELWKYLRYEVIVIDYFLNHFVFPRHAKQFKIKIQASGWDIPLLQLLPPDGTAQGSTMQRRPLTTGFSGTNDNRTMLPLTIKQQDLAGLSHTNAEVLTYLLQPRNRHCTLIADQYGRHLSEEDLLRRICNMGIRILIDAGAQILEMENRDLAKAWLTIDHKAPAAVYFDAANKPFVLYHNNTQVPLLASPFANDLRDCLVYLDEAHTRGTDLKMPINARGALTLGLGQTKDHTVQAAMRLRQLGTTQSVTFFAPPEVHQSILDLRKRTGAGPVDSYDVIHWLLEQTCSGIAQLQPLYYSQGVDFCRRSQAGIDNPAAITDVEQRKKYLKALRQIEHQTLEQLYSVKPPNSKSKSTTKPESYSPQISAYMTDLNQRRKGFQDLGNAVHGSALQEVEQEREVAYEVESVREVQKPVQFTPLRFRGLHRNLSNFVETGRLPASFAGVEHVLEALRRTHLGIKFGIHTGATDSKFFVSTEFSRTVDLQRPNDNFMRQVNWIIWSTITETAIIVTPEEAEKIIATLRDVANPCVHLLTYAAPVTRRMLHLNDLKFYAIPPLPVDWVCPQWLKTELGIFAGRLYYEFHEHKSLTKFLGLGEDETMAQPQDNIDSLITVDNQGLDDVVMQGVEQPLVVDNAHRPKSFTHKPLTFLQEWIAVRRKGQDFTHTPMGHVCQGKTLTASHPFFAQSGPDNAQKHGGVASASAVAGGLATANIEGLDGGVSEVQSEFEENDGSTDVEDGFSEYEGDGGVDGEDVEWMSQAEGELELDTET